MDVKKNNRNINIDLFRVVSMFMIIVFHILRQGGVAHSFTPDTLGYNVAWFMELAVYCAVNCYALISGYVGINAKHHPANLATLWLQVFFYSVGITAIMHFTLVPTDLRSLLKTLLPVIGNMYWYFTSYFAMWFFIPFMNSAIDNLSKTKAGFYLIISGLILLPVSIWIDRFCLHSGYSAAWLGYMYLIGAYISKHKLFVGTSKVKALLVYVVCVIVTFAYKNIFSESESQNITLALASYVSPFSVIAAISLLVIFINLKIPYKCSRTITLMSTVSFGVYLIHVHPLVFQTMVIGKFGFLAEKNLFLMIIGVIAYTIGIFAACAVIDYIRLQLFKLLKVKQIFTAIINFAENLIHRIIKRFSKSNAT